MYTNIGDVAAMTLRHAYTCRYVRAMTMMHVDVWYICPKSAFDGVLTVFVINEYET